MVAVVLFVAVMVVSFLFLKSIYSTGEKGLADNLPIVSDTEEKKEECKDCVRRLLDGVKVKPQNANYTPAAVMIDNHVDARPANGLSEASLVYETEAEGKITRYLAFFDTGKKINKIGPVRSARPYFINWARGVDSLYVHCGGSPAALARLARGSIDNLNEFYNSSYFRRSNNRLAPHNIFTSTDKLKNYLSVLDKEKGDFESWKFKEDSQAEEPFDKEITLNFFDEGYNVSWRFNEEGNGYIRYLDGKKHKDAGGSQIRAKNVVIQYASTRVIDRKLRIDLDNIGEGTAIICRDGKCLEGAWEKPNKDTRTKYYFKKEGEEVKFNAGTTWVEVLREEYKDYNVY